MGACASVPKGFKGAGAGTEPEKPKEETAADASQEVSEVKTEEVEKEAVGSNTDDNKSKNNGGEVVSVNEDEKSAAAADDQKVEITADSATATAPAAAAAAPVKKEEEKKMEAPGYVLPTPKEAGEMTGEEALTGR